MMDNSVAYEVLDNRIQHIGECRDYLIKLCDLAEKLPEPQQSELRAKIGGIANILATELEQLRAWNLEHVVKH